MKRIARLALFFFFVTLAATAFARPGGGSSFKGGSSSSSRGSSSSSSSRSSGSSTYSSSGGGSSYSSGSSSGGGVSFGAVVVIALIIIIIWIIAMRNKNQNQGWSTIAPIPPEPFDGPPPRRQLEALQQTDPNFSLVLFDDFLVALYTEVQMARGRGTIPKYAPYLGPSAQSALSSPPGGEIANVIVGAMTMEEVSGLGPGETHVRVTVGFEANYAVRSPQGERALYVNETWSLVRRRDARSRTPDRTRVFGCPSCGAPLDVILAGTCRHCNRAVTNGDFDWLVDGVYLHSSEPRGPMLTSNVEEQGTQFPTVAAPDAMVRLHHVTQQDPNVNWGSISARVNHIFVEFQTAWANRDLATMRPYLSDALFSTQTYWVEEYKRQRLRNITENARITGMELANVASDAFYDAVTVRLWAQSLDFTVADDGGQIVSGNRSKERAYSEYWTVIRGRGVKGAPRTDKVCPKCGAPLAVSMAGNCNYCQTKVTGGGFDWVLSRIEQDEVYRG